MVEHLRQAERDLGRSCKVCCDLAGPKLRTGDVASTAGVIKWRPPRDDFGRTIAPALVRFVKDSSEAAFAGNTVPVRGDLLAKARVGDLVELHDARGRARALEIIEASAESCLCQAIRTAYGRSYRTDRAPPSEERCNGGCRNAAFASASAPPPGRRHARGGQRRGTGQERGL